MQKKETIRKLLAGNGMPETVADLATGKYYHGGTEISEKEFKRLQNKKVRIDLGGGSKPEN